MSTSQNRRLAAILFADIVGYTALMPKDEVTANQNLEKFHQTLNEKVSIHKGQVMRKLNIIPFIIAIVGWSILSFGQTYSLPPTPVFQLADDQLEWRLMGRRIVSNWRHRVMNY